MRVAKGGRIRCIVGLPRIERSIDIGDEPMPGADEEDEDRIMDR